LSLPRKTREELTKLRVLRYLSQPLDVESGATLKDAISSAMYDIGLPEGEAIRQRGDLNRLLPEMQRAGLIGRRPEPDPRDGKSRPYFITDEGRRYLEDAQQRALLFEPNQRVGWAEREPVIDEQGALAEFVRALPEFWGSDEARIHEVAYQLHHLIEQFSRAAGPRR
jgi:hypothetical protein